MVTGQPSNNHSSICKYMLVVYMRRQLSAACVLDGAAAGQLHPYFIPVCVFLCMSYARRTNSLQNMHDALYTHPGSVPDTHDSGILPGSDQYILVNVCF